VTRRCVQNIDLRPVGNKNSMSKTAMALLCASEGGVVSWLGECCAPLSSFQLYRATQIFLPFCSSPSHLSCPAAQGFIDLCVCMCAAAAAARAR
jgi:hypothetical protein